MINVKIADSKKCGYDKSIYVSFNYDEKIVNAIRGCSQRFWDSKNKVWELPLNALEQLVKMLPNYSFDITGAFSLKEKDDELPEDFEFKTKPFPHQIDGVKYGLTHDRWVLGDDMGLGKSKQVIDLAVIKKMQNGYKHCLIICGVNTLKWNWLEEIKTHSNESAFLIGGRYNNHHKLKVGSNNDKLDDLSSISSISAYFLVINVESLRDEKIVAKIVDLCKSKEIGMIAFDECHKAKNPSSQQGKGVLKIHADTMVAMTGTPLMNSPLDLYIILKWLGYENHSFYQFKNYYCQMGGYGGYQIMGYKHLDELQSELNAIMLRRHKEDVLDLPEKMYINEYVEMTPKQEQIYKEVTQAIKMNIDQIKMANNPLAELIRMRQATGYTGILSSSIKESAKLDRLEELVEEAVENGKKVVIFSNWTQMTDIIKTRLANKYKGVTITGQTNDTDRQVNVNHFQTNPECKYIIGTIGAMGTGLTLTAGTVEIFVDEPWSTALKEQAVDRCYRIGQKNAITVYTLMAKDTIDERINEIVEKKGAMADAIVDGHIVGDKRELLEYLLS